jgi:hypothetical protein
MAAWLVAAIDRLPPRARRMVVAATAVLLVAGAITALTLETRPGGGGRRRTAIASRPSRRAPARPLKPPVSPPVSATDLRAARVVAGRFLVSYLQFAYGRGSAGAVKVVTPELYSQLVTQRVQATPAERDRHPRVVSLAMVGTTPGFVVGTATIEDGGITAYRLRFTLREQAGRWSASSVREG